MVCCVMNRRKLMKVEEKKDGDSNGPGIWPAWGQ